MSRLRITECLDIDLDNERWCCNRCGQDIYDARDNYKKGCLIAERDMAEVHPPMVDGAAYCFTPDSDYCRLLEFYCPNCGTMLENEYLPPGHPITHEIELDIDVLKAKQAQQAEQGA